LAIQKLARLRRHTVMASYRYYFLDATDHVTSTGLIECDTDSEAQICADRLLAGSNHEGIEVWNGSRQIHYAQKAPKAT
jgi:hypothetical protein